MPALAPASSPHVATRSLPASDPSQAHFDHWRAGRSLGVKLNGAYRAQEHHQEYPQLVGVAPGSTSTWRMANSSCCSARLAPEDNVSHRCRAGETDHGTCPDRRRATSATGARPSATSRWCCSRSSLSRCRRRNLTSAEVEVQQFRRGDRRARRRSWPDVARRASARARPTGSRAARCSASRSDGLSCAAAPVPDGRATVDARRHAARGAAASARSGAPRQTFAVRHARPDRGRSSIERRGRRSSTTRPSLTGAPYEVPTDPGTPSLHVHSDSRNDAGGRQLVRRAVMAPAGLRTALRGCRRRQQQMADH